MWMQLLQAAGFPPIGDAFPRDWEATIKDANPAGFWESDLRQGIYYRTNPDPRTGTYLVPEQTERHAVKVFVPGLVRTDRAYINKVVATVRPWRQYVRSLNRLYAMEREAKEATRKEGEDIPPPASMEPVIEWWVENFSLVSDIVTRRYPFYMIAYDSVLEHPQETVRSVFDWLGSGDVEAAAAQVEPSLRTQGDMQLESSVGRENAFDPAVTEVFDAFYEVVRSRRALDQPFVDRLNQTNEALQDQIEAEVRRATRAHLERQRAMKARAEGV